MTSKLEALGEDVTALASEQECCKWHYIFTKGYVNTLRSRRAMPGDYWTATTVEDYMRCKVINYPIGVQNEAVRRDAFKTWILGNKSMEDGEKNKKGLFVVIFDPNTQDVKFVKNFSLSVNSKVETLALLEHINLGTFLVTSELLAAVAEGAGAGPHPRVFLRRIFPIQDEREEHQQEVVVEELTLGKVVTTSTTATCWWRSRGRPPPTASTSTSSSSPECGRWQSCSGPSGARGRRWSCSWTPRWRWRRW